MKNHGAYVSSIAKATPAPSSSPNAHGKAVSAAAKSDCGKKPKGEKSKNPKAENHPTGKHSSHPTGKPSTHATGKPSSHPTGKPSTLQNKS